MMNARTLLFRQIQQFFEQYLSDLYRISDVRFDLPELAPKEKGVRQRPKEVVIGSFGHYTIAIHSTVESPPLGRLLCIDMQGHQVSGPIDAVTWRDIARMIKSPERILQNVDD